MQQLSREQKIAAIELLQEKLDRQNKTKFLSVFDSFYVWQRDFVASTAEYHEACLCAANQIGKTYTGTTIDAIHLLGDYPDDWPGHKFEFAPLCWALGFSMEKTRDLIQTALFGKWENGGFAGGLVPKERIAAHESATGVPNAMRSVSVKHKSGAISKIQFWSYSQGQHAIMGDVVDWVHIDEEPRDQTIRPQVITRTINGDKGKGGRIIYTFTPENGRTDLVIKFMDTPSANQFFMMKGWDDAPHMTEEKRERLLGQFPEHQKDMRSKGIPMLGHGRIYDLGDEFIQCDPFEIPDHFFVIGGMDFGWDHPQGHALLVEDRDNDIVYLARSFKAAKMSANDAWGAVQDWAKDVPYAWPHDGLQHEKGRKDATQQKEHYAKAGFNMLPKHATWPDGGNSVETGLYLINDAMRKGKFKVFRGCIDFMEEFRQYHRDDKGKIVKVRDDILDSARYAYMMRRYAKRFGDIGKKKGKKLKFSGWSG